MIIIDRDEARERAPWDHAHVARPCTIADIFTVTGDAPEDQDYLAKIGGYLADFAAPISDKGRESKVCLHCGADLGGMFGSFQWGICHGEGHCSVCGYPARAHHFAKAADGSELLTLRNFILQYMPDDKRMRAASADTRPKDEDAVQQAASLASGAVPSESEGDANA